MIVAKSNKWSITYVVSKKKTSPWTSRGGYDFFSATYRIMALGMLDWRDSIPIHHKQLGCKRSIGLQIMDFFLHPSAKNCKFNTYIAILPETPVSRIRVSSKLPIRVSCPVFESTCPTASLTDDGNPWDHD